MSAADLTVLAVGIFSLVEGADIGFAHGDTHPGRPRKAEGVDRRCGPGLAVATMIITFGVSRLRRAKVAPAG
jgi:hypothetical protein